MANKSKDDLTPKHRFNFLLDFELFVRLREISKRLDKPMASLVVKEIEKMVERMEGEMG